MPVVAALTLTRYPWRAVPSVVRRRRIEGARFSRVLGTGRGFSLGKGGDLRRWATFSVWDADDERLDRALARPDAAVEHWAVKLDPLSCHGSWDGEDPLHDARPGTDGGPVAVLTRATIPARRWLAFYRSVPAVERWLHTQDGLRAAVGIGERPVGRQATFSVWQDAAALEAFAYRSGSPHHGVVTATHRNGWFSEELFARFRPYGASGTWSGKDPLA